MRLRSDKTTYERKYFIYMQKEKIEILGVRFGNISSGEALKKALEYAKDTHQHYIATPNPEFLLEAKKNEKFCDVLNNSDMNIPDGIGILWAAKYLDITGKNKSKVARFGKWFLSLTSVAIYPRYVKNPLNERITGIDLMIKICEESAKEGLKVFLLGAAEGTAEKAKETLENKYKNIKIVGTFAGSPKEQDEAEIIERINHHSPAILFVAYGAPAQELWINKNLKKLSSVKLAMGVGGAFDFIAGGKKRAPSWARKIGLEWLFRLIQEPRRLGRIYRATIKFPLTILKSSRK